MLLNQNDKTKSSQGIFVVEILIVVAIIGIAFVGLVGTAAFSLRASTLIKQTTQAKNLAQETIEVVRSFRDGTVWDTGGLGTLNTGDSNPYYPQLDTGVNPPQWTLATGSETINGFTREIILEKVSRNPTTGNIEDTYNINNDDPDTRKVRVNVSWKNKKVEIITYFTNWN